LSCIALPRFGALAVKSCLSAGAFEGVRSEGFSRAERARGPHAFRGCLPRGPGEDGRGEGVGIPAGPSAPYSTIRPGMPSNLPPPEAAVPARLAAGDGPGGGHRPATARRPRRTGRYGRVSISQGPDRLPAGKARGQPGRPARVGTGDPAARRRPAGDDRAAHRAAAAHAHLRWAGREVFWLVAQRGRRADWVRNIQANPRVRVKVRSGSRVGWRAGTAHILDEDDPRERQRLIGQANLARRFCVCASGAMATNPLTVRIDLDPR
jgi:hypothetical protein